MISLGIGIPFGRRGGIDAQAKAHFDRVIADGGLVPSGLSGVNAFFTTVKSIYATSDITTAISVGLDPQVLGYKLGAGSGTTLGQAAQKLYSCSGASGDVVQTTAASQPLLLVHEGANYWFGSGVSGNYVSTPNAAANQITGDLEVIVKFTTAGDMASNTIYSIAGKWNVGSSIGNNSWLVLTNDGGSNVITFVEDNGIAIRLITGSITWAPNTEYMFKFVSDVNNGAGGNTRYIYRSTDNGLNWTLLNSNTQVGIYVRSNPNRIVEVGSISSGAGINFKGKISLVTISNAIGGAPVVDFNPNQYNAANSQTQWVSTSGETWTINVGTATTGYKGVLVDRTIVQGDGVDDRLTSGTLPTRQYFTRFAAFNYLSAVLEYIISGNPISSHLIYNSGTGLRFWNDSSQISVSGDNPNRLLLLTGDYNGVSSKVRTNANADVLGTTGAATSTIVNLFSSGAGTLFSNSFINTEIDAVAVSNDTQKTAMYDYIRSINGNSF
jgi:hypothetical protein